MIPDRRRRRRQCNPRQRTLLIQALIALLWIFGTSAAADTISLKLTDREEKVDPTPYLSVLLDPSSLFTPEQYAKGSRTGFMPVRGAEPNFGYREGSIWLALPLENGLGRTVDFVVDFRVNHIDQLDAYWVGDGDDAVTLLLHTNSELPFSHRPIPYHQLALPLPLAGEAAGTLLVRYESRGGTTLPLFIQERNAWERDARQSTAYLVASYSLILSFILVAIVAYFALRARPIGFYMLAMVCVMLYLAQVDGYAFAHFWPEQPGFNRIATPLLAAITTLAYCLFCWAYLDMPTRYPRINRWFLGFLVVQVVYLFFVTRHVSLAVISTSISSLVVGSLAIYVVVKEGRDQWLFAMGRLGFILATLIIGARELLQIDISYAGSIEVIRYASLWEAAALGLALVTLYRRFLLSQQEDQRRHIEALRANLVMQNRFRQLESRAELAAKIAESRSQQLADASHDLRQPLFSLRLAIRDLMQKRELDTMNMELVANNFSYLEKLVDDYLDQGLEPMDTADTASSSEPAGGGYEVSLVMSAVREMFANEAEESGIALHVMDTRCVSQGNATATLRIVNNFVANALKYCSRGDQVLVGLRRFDGVRYIAVYDTGPGMTQEELSQVHERLVRGSNAERNPDGKGLGLAIVADLAKAHDLRFYVRSELGRGSLFAIEVTGNP